jgi:hypothetical protein
MAVFLYTIGIGILNGSDLVDFDRRRLLGHVHGGTLGWLTLSVFAASLWLFGGDREPTPKERQVVRILVGAAITTFPAYVAAFSVTYGQARPGFGTLSLIAIFAFFAWVAMQARKVELGVPHVGFLSALGTSVVGGVIGVIWGFEIASGDQILPDGGGDAHPATMVVGFLIPISLAMAEWAFFFPRPPTATRLGVIQMVFPFLGGVLLMLSILLDIVPLAPMAILLEIVGLGIFFKRMWPQFRTLNWMEVSPARHAAFSVFAMVFVIGLAQYFIIKYEGDFDLVPLNQLLALDHAQFIGGTTNAIFAMFLAATMAKRKNSPHDQAVFFVVNLALIGFVVGLLADVTIAKRIFAPIMGVGLLMALGAYSARLWRAK